MFGPKEHKIIHAGDFEVYQDKFGNTFRIVPKWHERVADAVMKIGHGRGGAFAQVEREEDWTVIEQLTDLFAHLYPQEWEDFLESTAILRKYRTSKHGLLGDSKDNNALIRQVAQWPMTWELLIRTVYPNQKFDKKFIDRFVKRLPAFSTIN